MFQGREMPFSFSMKKNKSAAEIWELINKENETKEPELLPRRIFCFFCFPCFFHLNNKDKLIKQ